MVDPTELSTPAAQERHTLPHDVLARMIRAGYGKFGSYSGMQVVWDASPGPDLLEALREARDTMNGVPNTVGLHHLINAAIAKATDQ